MYKYSGQLLFQQSANVTCQSEEQFSFDHSEYSSKQVSSRKRKRIALAPYGYLHTVSSARKARGCRVDNQHRTLGARTSQRPSRESSFAFVSRSYTPQTKVVQILTSCYARHWRAPSYGRLPSVAVDSAAFGEDKSSRRWHTAVPTDDDSISYEANRSSRCISSLRADSTLQSSCTQFHANYPGRRLCARLLVVEHGERVEGAVGQTRCAREDWLLLAHRVLVTSWIDEQASFTRGDI